MALIAELSDASLLTRSLSMWETAEYVCCGLVAVACAGEYIADFTNWLTAGDEWRKKRLAKGSTLLLIASLACELFCLVQTNSISGQLIGSLSDKATNADTKAQSALDKSGTAEIKADAAVRKSDDLLAKYTAAEREIIELKAAKLPRRLSSNQKEIFRSAVTSFKGETFNIFCATPGGDAKEPLDFEMDFVNAMGLPNVSSVPKVPVNVGYLITCSVMLVGGIFIPPIQVEAGIDRQGDADILVKALKKIGINKKDITRKPNDNKALLSLTIGPKAP
jgi:hypothetical protein